MTAAELDDEYLSPVEIAAKFHWSRQTVNAAINAGDLPALEYGRTRRVKRSDLDAFIAAHTTTAGREQGVRRPVRHRTRKPA